MLKFDTHNRIVKPLELTELKAETLLERNDLQQTICNSWELFKYEIGLPSAYLIGQEVQPDGPTQNRIDLLAFDPDDSSLIVIELKRDRDKLQLLQSLSYAAMVAKWDSEILISKIQQQYTSEVDELIDLINANELNPEIKIILIAENYDPEVIITADWLVDNYSLNIIAFSISLHKMGSDTFLSLDQRYPLKELSDSYEVRGSGKRKKKEKVEIDWADVIPKLEYPFAQEAIDSCLAIKSGEPSRRRFGMLRTNKDGFNWISVNFRKKYINIYMKGKFDGDEQFLKSKFGDSTEIGSWRDGWSVKVHTQPEYEIMKRWLELN